jgi:hypothetical protein
MKATLEFTLPEEQEEFASAVAGSAYKSVVCELQAELRNRIKYAEDTQLPEVTEAYVQLRQFLLEQLEDRDLSTF